VIGRLMELVFLMNKYNYGPFLFEPVIMEFVHAIYLSRLEIGVCI
jgi:hypothetical protein